MGLTVPPTSDMRVLPIKSLSRVEGLYLGEFNGNVGSLSDLLMSPAPILEVAEVHFPSPPTTSHESLFRGDAPHLRRLSVSGITSFPWDSPILRNLVCLKIQRHPSEAPILSSRADVVLALQKITVLESLALVHCIPDSTADQLHVDDLVVSLAHLTNLSLAGSVQNCIGILDHITLPRTGITLSLDCSTSGNVTAFRVLFPIIRAAGGATPSPFSSLKFKFSTFGCFSVTGQRLTDEKTSYLSWFAFSLFLYLKWDLQNEWNAVDVMCETCKAVSVDHHQTLWVNSWDEFEEITDGVPAHRFEPSTWLETFGSATNVQEVNVWGHASLSFCQALSQWTSDGTSWRRRLTSQMEPNLGTYFLPRLYSLLLCLHGSQHHHIFEDGLLLQDLFAMSLRARTACGASPLNLNLPFCTADFESALEGLVECLEVDEYVIDTDGEDGDEDEDEFFDDESDVELELQ
ncbi:hypothetical protein BV25DRAFT_762968 [Artomyces pyxidatus]|uniref:Uncharacterized protein n=1 Tax=Artomyces pyxidatus TaxID=48021 RepID=A0ACB8SZ95_9AGAM|nr:hypothetical protein BV25DRAFT_762968 [Artomyces pyxidatus]